MTSTNDCVGVSGASGQLGISVAQALIQRFTPRKLVLLSRTPEKLGAFVKKGAQVRKSDLDHPEGSALAFTGLSTLLLISTDALGRRVAQHATAIASAAAAGVKRIVYTSLVGAEAGSPALAASDHCATERMLRASGVQWTILRHAQYAEAILDVIMPNALAAGEWRSCSGEGRIAPVSRDDCAACAAAALLREDIAGRVFNITGPDLLTYRQMAALMVRHTGQSIRYVPVGEAGLYAMFDALGAPRVPSALSPGGFPWCSDDMVSFESALRGGWFNVSSNDTRELLGRSPRSFADLLQARLKAMKEEDA